MPLTWRYGVTNITNNGRQTDLRAEKFVPRILRIKGKKGRYTVNKIFLKLWEDV
jgi:hypothetical protein